MGDIKDKLAAMQETTNTAAPTSALNDIGLYDQITGLNPEPVDESATSDSPTFPVEKLSAHIKNIRHLAISVFVFNEDRLLLQRRADTKYHSGGLWANTVCSHPRWQESASVCADRRLNEELGWNTPLQPGAKISYNAQVGDLYENEYVHCFYGSISRSQPAENSEIKALSKLFNPTEVSELQWMSMQDIDTALGKTPELFSAWFRIYMSTHRSKLNEMMNAASLMHQSALSS